MLVIRGSLFLGRIGEGIQASRDIAFLPHLQRGFRETAATSRRDPSSTDTRLSHKHQCSGPARNVDATSQAPSAERGRKDAQQAVQITISNASEAQHWL